MSYNKAKEAHKAVSDMLRYDRTVFSVSIENRSGSFHILVGSTHPKGVEVPDEIDGTPIRVAEVRPPSPYEPRD